MMMRWFAKMIRINLPDLGEGTKEATIKEWFVKEGQKIKEYDDICEVFTDKLVAKIPSTHDGVIKSIKFKSDEICLVGHALIEIEVEEDKNAPTASTNAASANKV
jgi:2-oxoisovalerate dehydrogenase E2 component (dihydrolipoyl transacylase)